MKNLIGQVYRHLRRWYYKKLNPGYIRQSIARRKGKCRMCGCCKDRLIKCNYLEGKTCTLWRDRGFDALPEDCKNYPFDEKDKAPFSKENCGFYWGKA